MNKLAKKNIEDIFALTPMQQGMLFHYLKTPAGEHYFEQLILHINGSIDVELFKKAWKRVVETNEILRTLFRWESLEKPIQITLKEYEPNISFFDFSNESTCHKKNNPEEIKKKDREEKFHLEEVPFRVTLCKIEENKYEMIVSNHHILYDGWSNGIILKEFFNTFEDISNGKNIPAPQKTKFKEFVRWINTQDTATQEVFWSEYLKDFTAADRNINIGNLKAKRSKNIIRTGNYQTKLATGLKGRLYDFVKMHNITLASVLYSAWGILLLMLHQEDQMLFDTTVSGRTKEIKGIEDIVGLFINTLPLGIKAHRNQNLLALVTGVYQSLQKWEEFENTSQVIVKEYLEKCYREPLFDALVVLENYPLEKQLLQTTGKLTVDSFSITGGAHYDITLIITIFDDIKLCFTYNRALFNEETTAVLSRCFVAVMDEIVTNPFKKLHQMHLSLMKEREKILHHLQISQQTLPYTDEIEYTAPGNELEERVAGIWSKVLNIDQAKIGIDADFFAFGGHSLKASMLVSLLYQELHIKVPLSEIFHRPSIRALAKYIKGTGESQYTRFPGAETKEYYPLSSAQKRFYMLQQLDLGSSAYNAYLFMTLEGKLHRNKLERTFSRLIHRHESLRTAFIYHRGEPWQKILPGVNFSLKYFEITKEESKKIILDFVRPFDLSKPPLIRVGLIKLKDENKKYILLFDMHHIISDGSSVNILVKEFMELYRGDRLPIPKYQYKDFSEWQNNRLKSGKLKTQEKFWVDCFSGEIPVLDMPCDYPRPGVQSFAGERRIFYFNEILASRLFHLTRSTGKTLYMIILAGLGILLNKYAGARDVIIGTPVAGRNHKDLMNIFGLLLEVIVLRIYPEDWKPFHLYLDEVKNITLRSFDNQDYPFGELIKQLPSKDDLSRNQLFDIMLIVQNQGRLELEIDDLKISPLEFENNTSKVDINLEVFEIQEEKQKEIRVELEYCTKLFKREAMERFFKHFELVLNQVVTAPDLKVGEIDILTKEEKKQILESFNHTNTAVALAEEGGSWLLDELFNRQVEKTPDHIALVGPKLQITNYKATAITYQELQKKSIQLAYVLRKKGVGPGTIVGIMGERSIGTVIGIWGILKAGGAYLPIDPEYPDDRINYMLSDSGANVLITASMPAKKVKKNLEVIFMDSYECSVFSSSQLLNFSTSFPSSLAYVMYTSGTTGKPKGVAVEQESVVNVVNWFGETFEVGPGTHLLQLTEYTFDPSVEDIFATLLHGGTLFIADKELVFSRERFSDFVQEHQVHIVNYVPLVLNQLLGEGEKLKSLRVVISGGEKLNEKVKDRIIGKGYRLYNNYGPTEVTVDALSGLCTGKRVTLGKPIFNAACYIVDKKGHLVPVGIVGELWISGAGVARGYLNQPELTNEKLLQGVQGDSFLEKSPPGRRRQKTYKTGDLGRWLANGNIEFLGRLDRQVKIRGYRVELGEIEKELSTYKGINEVAAVPVRNNAICAYFISREEKNVRELRNFLSEKLPNYMIPAYFTRLEKMPLTARGKIDTRALPAPGESTINTGGEYVPPQGEIENQLVAIWQELLRHEPIGIEDNFFDLGGDSVLVNRCLVGIRHAMDTDISLRKFFERPYIKALAEEIEKQERHVFSIKPAERKEDIPLSFAQERLWFLQELDTQNVAYFVPRVIRIKGKPDVHLIERTFTELIRRHEILRTVFPNIDGQPVQRIQPPYCFKIPVLDWSRLAKEERERKISDFLCEEGLRPFDFDKGPLLRVTLLKIEEKEYLFVLTEHHLIHDGWTQGVLLSEFISIFSAYREGRNHDLPELPIQYADYAIWERSYLQGECLKRHLDYWQEKLSGLIPVLELPVDRPRPAVLSGQGALHEFHLSSTLTRQLKEFSRENSVTLFVTMLAVFNTFLYRYTGTNDICVGTGIANRNRKEMENMLGMVINSLPLRVHTPGDMIFRQYLSQVKETCLEAYQYQDTPFGKIVEVMEQERSLSYSPIFQVMFSFMDTPGQDLRLPGLELHSESTHNNSAKFDLDLVVVPPMQRERDGAFAVNNSRILVQWEYNTDIFDAETINRMIRHYTRLLEVAVLHPDVPISNLPILEEDEIKRLLHEWNETGADYPKEKTICQLFAEQVEKTPDNIAVIGEMQSLVPNVQCMGRSKKRHAPYAMRGAITYRQLNDRSRRLTCLLIQKGVHVDNIVGIMMERCIEMIIGILGILQSGGAYLPIDPGFPEKRIAYMLKDSNANICLVSPGTRPKVKARSNENHWQGHGLPLQSINIETELSPAFEHSFSSLTSTLTCQVSPANLSYIMYTSGSTGQPKGVMIRHNSLTDFTTWAVDEFEHRAGYQVLLSNSYASDGSIQQIFPPLISGGSLHVIRKELRLDVARYLDYLKINRINNIDEVPVLMKELAALIESGDREEKLPDLTCLSLGSEYVPIELVKKCRRHLNHHGRIINAYGPAEASVEATTYHFDGTSESEQSLIGKPRRNIRVYILDAAGHCCPIGVRGEICVSGVGLARGYLNRPELTAEKFNRQRNNGFNGSHISCLSYYKTGDRGCWLPDGNIRFCGRVDDQIKIRGYRVELQEIETILKSHKTIKDAVVLTRENSTGELEICAYYVRETQEKPSLWKYVQERLPSYMIPSYLMELEKIPLTINGKVDKNALPRPVAGSSGEYLPPRNRIEKKLVEVWAGILSRSPETIGIHTDFFKVGGHSLKAALLTARIQKQLEVEIPIAQVFKTPTIAGLAGYLNMAGKSEYTSIEPVESKEYYDLTPVQKRLYFLQQMDPGSPVYNVPAFITLEKSISKEKLLEIFKKIIQRHDILRTSYEMFHDVPGQKVHETVEFEIEIMGKDVQPWSFIRPFDLSGAPLVRVGLIQEEEEKYILAVDMHHIICDPISHEVLMDEFNALCNNQELPGLKLQYKDYAAWQNSETQKTKIIQQENYWLHLLSGNLPEPELPLDFPRPRVQGFEGDSMDFIIGQEETHRLKNIARNHNVTHFMILLALFNVLLSKLSGEEDIIVGIPVSTRQHENIEKMIGMFLNTLVLRNGPAGHKTFSHFLQEVKNKTLAAYDNTDYPFEELVDKIVVSRNTSRNPIFDVMFNYYHQTGAPPGGAGEEKKTSKFDLTLTVVEVEKEFLSRFQYSTLLFKQETIQRLIDYFKNIVSRIISNPGIKIFEVEIIPGNTRKELLDHFNENLNETYAIMPIQSRLANVFLKYKNNIAIEYGTTRLTYAELEHRAACISQWIARNNIPGESFIGIHTRDKTDIISAIIGILQGGCIFVPLDTVLPGKRIERMIRLTNMRAILTDTFHEAILTGIKEKVPETVHIFALNDSFYGSRELDGYNNPAITAITGITHKPEDKIYVYFTSGSTGLPNAIVGRNKSLVQFIQWEIDTFAIDETYRIGQLTAVGFDAFLRDIFVPLLAGGTICIPPNKEILMEGNNLIQWLESNRINLVHYVPTLFRIIDTQQLTPASFPHLKYVLLSGEPIIPHHLQEWYRVIGPRIQLVNYYGPTETTMIKTFHLIKMSDSKADRIPAGGPIRGARTIILDSHMNICHRGTRGEIYIRTAYNTYGYLDNPGLTAQRFIKNPFGTGKGDFIYKTGDIGRQLENGEIEVLGRIDRQVKIRGARIELENIENCLLKHSRIERSIVISRKSKTGENFLCAYIIFKKQETAGGVRPDNSVSTPAAPALREHLAKELPDYMIPAYFIPIEKVPLTPNGKIDVKALPGHEIKIPGSYTAPRSAIEKKLVELWSDVLGIGKDMISIDSNFFQLGGNSLKLMTLIAKIHRELDIIVPLGEMFKTPDIKGLSEYIKKLGNEHPEEVKDKYVSIEPTEKKEYYALSSAQKRLYFLQQMDKTVTAYNIPSILTLEGILDKDRLEQSLVKLIHRHESLRTSIDIIEEEPVQRIHELVEFQVEYYQDKLAQELNACDDQGPGSKDPGAKSIIYSFIRPFDFTRAPLLRAGLVKSGEKKHLLLIDMHHIISDGMSFQVLEDDFSFLYAGKELPAVTFQYKDYVQWQNRERAGNNIVEQSKYWKKEYEGEIPVLELPTDYARPAVQCFGGNRINFEINRETSAALKALALASGTTLYIVLLALYTILLAKLSSREDIVIGSPVAGRRHADLEKIIGMFVNTLALRHYPAGEKRFTDFLREVKTIVLNGFENQEYQYEDLVEQIPVNRDASRNPLFDTMFVLQNTGVQEIEIPGLKLIPYEYENQTSKFDLSLTGVEVREKLMFTFEYSTKLFKRETIQRFIVYFKKIVRRIVENKNLEICHLDILPEEEKNRVLFEFNNTEAGYPKDKTIHGLFEEQVERTPDYIAVIGKMHSAGSKAQSIVREEEHHQPCAMHCALTYRELNKRASRLARLLIEKSVRPDTIVAIMTERSVEMIIGIMGILKSGGAYLPIDPDYPHDRIDYILRDSKANVLITTSMLAKKVKKNLEIIFMDSYECSVFSTSQLLNFSTSFPSFPSSLAPSSLAYIIYTSGTTGKPKGSAIKHRSLVNRLNWMQKKYPLNTGDTILQKTTFTFDVSVWEIFWWSMAGARLCLLHPGGEKDPQLITQTVEKNNITIMHFVPPMLSVFLDYLEASGQVKRLSCLKQVIVSGEALLPVHVERFKQLLNRENGTLLANLYGPTEATIDVAYFDCIEGKTREIIPIGKPIDNTRLYILDKNLYLQPVGIPGELYISGICLASGYLNQPELTARRFILATKSQSHKDVYFSWCPGARVDQLYKTGDLARWFADGNIEFLGRMDLQVKIRGFRIELGEIENQLLGHPRINQALVVPYQDTAGDKNLCAYIVLNLDGSTRTIPDFSPVPKSQTTIIEELRTYLLKSLPAYMVPPYFMILDKMPLTGNGKIDRRALPAPGIETGAEYVGPRDEAEKGIVYMVADILGTDPARISIQTNLFSIGLNSITILKLAHRISGEFSIDFPVGTLFTNPSVEGIAADMKKRSLPAAPGRAVLLNRKKAVQNLFLISGDGRIYIFKELALLLEGHFNVYGIQGKGIMDTGKLPETRQEIYHDFIREIKRIQPEGPYILGGHCFGAIISYEVTRVLEEQKNEVTKLVLLDHHAVMRDYIMNFIILFRWFNKCRRVIDIIKKTARTIKRKPGREGRANRQKAVNDNPGTIPEDLEARRMEVEKNYRRVMNKLWIYSRIVKAPILSVKAEESGSDPDPRWNPDTIARTSRKNVEQVITPGDHYNMFEVPHVPVLARQLTERICPEGE